VSDALVVHVNRDELHGLAVPDSFEAGESFDVVLVNHGESTHVHLHLDDALSEQAALEAPNHHVEGGSERRVRVTRTAELPVGPIVVAGGLVLALAVGTAAVVGSSVAVVAAVGIGLVALGVVAATLMVGP